MTRAILESIGLMETGLGSFRPSFPQEKSGAGGISEHDGKPGFLQFLGVV